MLRRKTVFVVGAGASKEFGLPLGYELGTGIARTLDIRFKNGVELISGDGEIYETIRRHLLSVGEHDPNPWLHACWRIRDALPHHNSIDNLIDNHAGDDKVAQCGKLAIAKTLLAAEKASALWFSPVDTKNEINFRAVEDTWLAVLFRMMQEGTHRSKAHSFFDNTAIITFNYDRCIEHYFYRALCHAYGLSEAEAGRIVSNAVIHHVYGSVGPLPWQDGQGVPFGGGGVWNLLSCAESLRTYSEQQAGTKEGDEIRHLIAEGDAIVFLGFGHLGTNTSLLKPTRKVKASLILGSALGFSKFNASHVGEQFIPWFEPRPDVRDLIKMDDGATAAKLLADYGKALV